MTATLDFKGAHQCVTGSRTLVQLGDFKFLVDCGLFQGPKTARARNWKQIDQKNEGFEAVFLTHAHLDHSGFIPRLCKDGFDGPIHCTQGTFELAKLILMDSAYLEEETAKYANSSRYSRHDPCLPLFTMDDARHCLQYFQTSKRDEWKEVGPGISVRYLRAGHIIGASIIQFQVMIGQKTRIITFSGDLGHQRSLTMKGPAHVTETDILVLESTYGNRLHPREEPLEELAKLVREIYEKKSTLLIPSFAVGRAQDLIYLFKVLEDKGDIPSIPVILDSPMATEATRIFMRRQEDQKTLEGFNPVQGLTPKRFRAIASPKESEDLGRQKGPRILISSSGMLAGGRVLHHLKRMMPDEKNIVLFTGYQAEGTKGRWVQDHTDAPLMRIHGQEVPMNARIETFDHLSAHADYQDMIDWLGGLQRPPSLIILNHGTPQSQAEFKKHIEKKYGYKVVLSSENSHIDLNDELLP